MPGSCGDMHCHGNDRKCLSHVTYTTRRACVCLPWPRLLPGASSSYTGTCCKGPRGPQQAPAARCASWQRTVTRRCAGPQRRPGNARLLVPGEMWGNARSEEATVGAPVPRRGGGNVMLLHLHALPLACLHPAGLDKRRQWLGVEHKVLHSQRARCFSTWKTHKTLTQHN
jgi:hypothetical protein